jgi:hypothetical protein
MNVQRETSGAKTSSQPARTRSLDSRPHQLDAEHAAAPAGPLDATQRPAVRMDEGRAAAQRALSSKADTVTGEGLRSASQALAPSLAY